MATIHTPPSASTVPQGVTEHTVCVVDDDPRLCQLLGHHLSGEEYQVYTSTCAEKFFERMNNAPADLIILDVMLADKDGF